MHGVGKLVSEDISGCSQKVEVLGHGRTLEGRGRRVSGLGVTLIMELPGIQSMFEAVPEIGGYFPE